MNNIKVLFGTLAFVLCLVSCNDKIESELAGTFEPITVTSSVDCLTKAGYEKTAVLPDKFIIDIDQSGSSPDYHRTMVKAQANSYVFLNNEDLFWADNSHQNVSIKAMTLPIGASDNSGTMSVSVKNDQRQEADVIASDLLGATTDNGTIVISNHNINIDFKHLMSKLQVTYNASNTQISSIKVTGLCVGGEYSYDSMTYGRAGNIGDIWMYLNTDNTAEAIFFPYTPSSNPVIEISATVDGESVNMTCPVSLSKITRFEGGKRYIMNIAIEGSTIKGAEVTVKDWTIDNNSIQITGENVLWIGTSIPGGWPERGITSYPEIVDEAMNCNITNNAIPSTTVVRQIDAQWIRSNTTKAQWDDRNSVLHIQAGGLSITQEEANAYSSALETVYMAAYPDPGAEPKVRNKPNPDDYWRGEKNTQYKNDLAAYEAEVEAHDEWQVKYDARQEALATVGAWVEEQIAKILSYSYTDLIIPHIDGTAGKTQCTTVIIDHGYNDRGAMIAEALGLAQRPESVMAGPEHVEGYNYLMKLISNVIDYDEYIGHVNDPDFSGLAALQHYIVEMGEVITAIRNTNPNVRIIIGNYFSNRNPYISEEFNSYANSMYFTELICYFNEAVASLFDLEIVNVYDHIWLDESKFITFCTDKVHPWTSQLAIDAIAQIYINELDGVVGSRN